MLDLTQMDNPLRGKEQHSDARDALTGLLLADIMEPRELRQVATRRAQTQIWIRRSGQARLVADTACTVSADPFRMGRRPAMVSASRRRAVCRERARLPWRRRMRRQRGRALAAGQNVRRESLSASPVVIPLDRAGMEGGGRPGMLAALLCVSASDSSLELR
jgi:hypothetical protein